MITINNYKHTDVWDEKKMSYMAVAKQVAPSGTPHLQIYLQTTKEVQRNQVQAMLNTAGNSAHIEKCKGSSDQCRAYIVDDKKKTNVEPAIEYGTIEVHEGRGVKQGDRTDLKKLMEDIQNGISRTELLEKYGTAVDRHPKFIAMCEEMREREGTEEVKYPLVLPWMTINKPDPANKKRQLRS